MYKVKDVCKAKTREVKKNFKVGKPRVACHDFFLIVDQILSSLSSSVVNELPYTLH